MLYSKQHNCVVYEHSEPYQVVAAIAEARPLNGKFVAVPATLHNMQLARLLGLPVPDLLDIAGYDWPIAPGRSPLAHQKYAANFHIMHPRHFDLSEMGTMKTLSALWAADYLMQEGLVHRCLIISPLSTLKRVWEDEIFRNFMSDRSSVILHGAREERLADLRRPRDFYIVNHDGVTIGTKRSSGGRQMTIGPLAQAIKDRDDIDLILVDECSAYKDYASLRTRVLRQAIAGKPYIWMLSGTPTPNSPTDAYSLARMLGGLQTESFKSFQSRVMHRISTFKWIANRGSADIVRQVLAPAVRFSRAECIDLPEVVVETRDVELSVTQNVAYKALKSDLQVTLKNGKTITAINEAVLRTKLLQITNGCVYGPDHEVHKTDAAPRFQVLKEIIDEAPAKVLVFAPFTAVVRMLYAELKAAYSEKAVAMITGAVGARQRDDIFGAFQQQDQPRMIVADPGTMSHGLSFPQAATIVWWGGTDRPEVYQQACDRITRPGQKLKMLIVHLASTPIERELYRRLHEKQSLQGIILKMVEADR